MYLKEYATTDGAPIGETVDGPGLDIEGARQRLADSKEFYDHQAMHGKAPDTIVQIPLRDIRESPTNPRSTYSEAAMAELTASVKEVGVMQAVLVRPVRLPIDPLTIDYYELVYGHRRFRAAQGAELQTMPCTVRELGDSECAQLQAIENLQREDLTALDEGQGYAAYIKAHGISKDELAVRIGKSRTHVYNRLKLAALIPQAAQALQDGKIKAEVATLVARVPVPLQAKALAEITAPDHPGRHGEPAPYRWVRDRLLEKFSLDLSLAIFASDDATLLPKAGACTTCPNRSGTCPEIYGDVIEQASLTQHWMSGKKGSTLICMDPECFAAKKKAHLVREAKALEDKGALVVTGNAAKNAIDAGGKVKGAYIELKAVKKVLNQIPEKDRPKVVTIQDQRTGKTVQAVKRTELAEFGADVAVAVAKPSHDNTYAEQRKKDQAEAERRTADNKRLLADVRAAAVKQPRTDVDLRLIARAMLENMPDEESHLVAELHGLNYGPELTPVIDTMTPDQLALLLLDFSLVQRVEVESYNLRTEPEILLDAAAHYGVQVGQGTVVAEEQGDEA